MILVHINNDITVDITLIPRINQTYSKKYKIYIGFAIYTKGVREHYPNISSGITVATNEWELGKVTGRNGDAKLLNERLTTYLNKAKIMLEDLAHKKPKTGLQVKNEITYNAKQCITGKAPQGSKKAFVSRLQEYSYSAIMEKCLAFNKPCPERQQKYQVPYKLLLEYFEQDLPLIHQITCEDLEGFTTWLREDDRFKPNTVSSYCCMIAAVFNHAKHLKIIIESPLPKGFSGKFEDGKRDIITEDEILSIQQIPDRTLPEGLLKAKYSLLFQSCTGLGIKEMKSIEYKHIKADSYNGKGYQYLQKERTKTGVEYTVVLSSNAKFVMNRLIELTGTTEMPFNLCSDSKINRHYRTLGSMVGITKSVAPYQFRHAYAVNFMDNGGRLEDLQKILGHKDPATTAIYGRISKERLIQSNQLLESRSKMHQTQPPQLQPLTPHRSHLMTAV